jgi:hypothetical protein
VEEAGTYEAEDGSGSGLVTAQVEGIGTIAGPPARVMMLRILAGKAPANDKALIVQSMPIAIGGSILGVWEGGLIANDCISEQICRKWDFVGQKDD